MKWVHKSKNKNGERKNPKRSEGLVLVVLSPCYVPVLQDLHAQALRITSPSSPGVGVTSLASISPNSCTWLLLEPFPVLPLTMAGNSFLINGGSTEPLVPAYPLSSPCLIPLFT